MSLHQLPDSYAGSLSEGTHRTQDLLPRFISALEAAWPEHPAVQDYTQVWDAARTLSTWSTLEWQNAEDILEAIGFWESTQANYLLNETVFDALQAVAPEGTSFGTAEGDGASFGFWPLDADPDLEDEASGDA